MGKLPATRPRRHGGPSEKPEVVHGEILVAARGRAIRDIVRKLGSVEGKLERLDVYRVRLRRRISLEDALVALSQDSRVLYAEPNVRTRSTAAPNDLLFGTQYAPQRVEAPKAWDIWRPVSPVILAVLDTGVDHDHPDLTNKMLRDADGIVGYNAFSKHRSSAPDMDGHGTKTAGIAAAQINNTDGIAGISGWTGDTSSTDAQFTKIMPIKVRRGTDHPLWGTEGSAAAAANGIVWASRHGAKVLNMSFAFPAYWGPLDNPFSGAPTVEEAVYEAWAKGCVLVASAGNDASSHKVSPAEMHGVLSVAATQYLDDLRSNSNYGSWVQTAAPGSEVWTTERGGGYAEFNDTSAAAPHAAGEAALILAHNPELNDEYVRHLIRTHIDPVIPYQGRTIGGGRINVFKALTAAGGPSLKLSVSPNDIELPAIPSPIVTVTLDTPAPKGGATVALSTLDPDALDVPLTVTVAAGQTTATFSATVTGLPEWNKTTIVAKCDGGVATTTLWIWPVLYHLRDVFADQRTIRQGREMAMHIALDELPRTDVVVALTSTRPDILRVPRTTTLAAHHKAKVLVFRPARVTAATKVTITAAIGDSTRRLTFTVVR